jgi:hypothetical protein
LPFIRHYLIVFRLYLKKKKSDIRDTLDTHDTRDSGSLVSLDLANNNLTRGKSNVHGGFKTDMAGVTALADALPKWYVSPADFCPTRHVSYQKSNASRSLSSLKFCGNGGARGSEGGPVTIDTTMTEADFSGKKLGVSGAIIVSAFIPKW